MTDYDVLAIGFGPANISLAIAQKEQSLGLKIKFLESRANCDWLPDVLINGSDIQNNPVRDLVTPVNPRSKYTYLNYLFEHEKLVEVLNLGLDFPLRKEYSRYIGWVGQQFEHLVDYNQRVKDIALLPNEMGYKVTTESGKEYTTKALVLGTGRTPYIPAPFDTVKSDRVVHFTKYLGAMSAIDKVEKPKRIAVVGSSQSAVEITLDLIARYPNAKIDNYIRSFGFRLKDTSPFMEESIMPEFVDYYFNASQESKDILDQDVRYTNYSASDMDVLKKLYVAMYEQKLDGEQRVFLKNNRNIVEASADQGSVTIASTERHYGTQEQQDYDVVILATGFKDIGVGDNKETCYPMIEPIRERLKVNDNGTLKINVDYSLSSASASQPLPPLYLFNLCESSHGVADSGSFSMISLRAKTVIDSLKKNF
ncbi:MAG: SidA/IucD/PvdA family monooxygenase [Algicola sp.]|nr:SidA/IucD/PvdA family monooxygenase [Algicola sp.]